jgi:hypothetical protein
MIMIIYKLAPYEHRIKTFVSFMLRSGATSQSRILCILWAPFL